MKGRQKAMTDTKASSESKKQFMLFGIKALHLALTIILFFIGWKAFQIYGFKQEESIADRYNYLVTVAYALVLSFFNRTYNSYLLGHSKRKTLVFVQFLSQLISVTVVYLAVSAAWAKLYPPFVFFPMLGIQLLLDIAWTSLGTRMFMRLYPPKRSILIYRNYIDKRRIRSIQGKPSERFYRIERELQYDGNSFNDIKPHLAGYEAVFVAGIDSRCRNGILKYCKEESIPGFFLPHVGDMIMREAIHIQSFDSPIFYVSRKHISPEYRIAKRAFDFGASLFGLIITSPIMIVTALAIRLYDGGPALYMQERLTLNGRRFKIYKFRSMRVDAEKDGIPRLSSGEKDDRITPIGRIVRKCRIDELPQLINILKGDMSMVGPRPERPEIAMEYCKQIPDFNLRLQVPAGLTGYAQVYGRYNSDPYEKLEFDLLYINNMSFFTDLQLFFATFAILATPESTQGVDSDQTTAIDIGVEGRTLERKVS